MLMSFVSSNLVQRRLREAKQVPLRMMKELQSVLAVRSVQKEKRKEERRHRKKKNQLPKRSSADSHPTSPCTEEPTIDIDEEVPVEGRGSNSNQNDVEASLKTEVIVSASLPVDAQTGNPCGYTSVSGQSETGTELYSTPDDSHVDDKLTRPRNLACTLNETETNTTLNPTLECVERPPVAAPLLPMPVGVCSLHVAQEAVAAAVRSSRVKAEEVFEDVDSDHEEATDLTHCT